jgi:hypothetical protein
VNVVPAVLNLGFTSKVRRADITRSAFSFHSH